MFNINKMDSDLDQAIAEHDRIMAESVDLLARARKAASPDGLIYRVKEDALCVRGAAYDPVANGSDDYADLKAAVSEEIDPQTMQLLESIGDALGMTWIEIGREWRAADEKLLGRIGDLQEISKNQANELQRLGARYESAQAQIAELEQQVATLTATHITSLQKDTEGLVKSLRNRTARISVLEDKVKALSVTSEPIVRDFQDRIEYLEAVLSTMMPPRSRV
jgi:hypothetical protein